MNIDEIKVIRTSLIVVSICLLIAIAVLVVVLYKESDYVIRNYLDVVFPILAVSEILALYGVRKLNKFLKSYKVVNKDGLFGQSMDEVKPASRTEE